MRRIALGVAVLAVAATAAVPAHAAPGDTTLVNVSGVDGKAYDAAGGPISDDGNLVLFAGLDHRFMWNDDNWQPDVFVRDVAGGTTELLSRSERGYQGESNSSAPLAMTPDGTWVLFSSTATNLLDEGDTDGRPLLYRANRVTHEIATVPNGGGAASRASISDDGMRVAIADNNGRVSAIDLTTNTQTPLAGGGDDGTCEGAALSGDGRTVSTVCFVKPDASADPTAQALQIDVATGARRTIVAPAQARYVYGRTMSVSRDGRFVAFESQAPVPPVTDDGADDNDVYVHDMVTGTNDLVSAPHPEAPQAAAGGTEARISADGRYVGYTTVGPPNSIPFALVYDRAEGDAEIAGRAQGASGRLPNALTSLVALSASGRFAVFTSLDRTLDPSRESASHHHGDVYLRSSPGQDDGPGTPGGTPTAGPASRGGASSASRTSPSSKSRTAAAGLRVTAELRGRTLRLVARNPFGTRLRGTIRVLRAGRLVATRRLTLAPRRSTTLRLRLRGRSTGPVVVRAVTRDRTGRVRRASATVRP